MRNVQNNFKITYNNVQDPHLYYKNLPYYIHKLQAFVLSKFSNLKVGIRTKI